MALENKIANLSKNVSTPQLNNQIHIVQDKTNLKQFWLNNVDDPSKLNINTENVEYSVVTTDNPKVLSFQFEPLNKANCNRTVRVQYDGLNVVGTPIQFKKFSEKLPEIEHNEDTKTITLSDVDDVSKISLNSKEKISYDIFEDVNDNKTFHIMYNNPDDYKNSFIVSYDSVKLNENPIGIGKYYKPGTVLFSSKKSLNQEVEEQPVIMKNQSPIGALKMSGSSDVSSNII